MEETKLGNLPDNWNVEQLRNLNCEFVAGGTPSRENSEYYGGDSPWLKTSEIQNSRVTGAEETLTKEGLENSSAKIIPPGSVLVAMYGGGTVGNVGLLEIEASTNQACCAIQVDESTLHNEFLYQYLLFDQKRLISYAAGSSQQNLNKSDVEQFYIAVPSLPEQRKIASILSTVDEVIRRTDEVIERTRELKRGLMQDLLTKGIGHDEFKEVQLGPKTVEVPVEWDTVKLEDIVLNKGQYGANLSAERYDPEESRYIRITDLTDEGGINDEEPKSIPREGNQKYELQKGDLLFARSGDPGLSYLHTAEGKGYAFAGYLIRFKPNPSKVYPQFLFYYTHSYIYKSWKNSMGRATTLSNINASEYRSLPVALPPLPEQRRIASILSAVDERIRGEEEYRERLRELKRGLMQDLLTGRVRVSGEVLG